MPSAANPLAELFNFGSEKPAFSGEKRCQSCFYLQILLPNLKCSAGVLLRLSGVWSSCDCERAVNQETANLLAELSVQDKNAFLRIFEMSVQI